MFGGGSFGGARRGAGSRGPVDNKRYYELLNVDGNATPEQIKKAYKRAALRLHPDKNPDPETQDKFKEVTEAYETLSDPEKKQIYDEYGEKVLKEGGGGSTGFHDPMDIFSAMFGGGMGGRGASRGPRKSEDVVHGLKVSLDELYNGVAKKLAIMRKRACRECKGSGKAAEAPPHQTFSCSQCSGQGVEVKLRQLGPGMVQQIQSVCSRCEGSGQAIPAKYKCKACRGARVVDDRKVIEVDVLKGMRHGQKITFRGEADEEPGTQPGDVVVVLQQKEHDVFDRKGTTLVMEKKVPLVDALCGATVTIKTLDKRTLIVKTRPGEVLEPNALRTVVGEGMPQQRRPTHHGVLVIKFSVEFPEHVDASRHGAALEEALGQRRTEPMVDESAEDVEVHEVVDFHESQLREGMSNGGAREAYESDDEDDEASGAGGGQRVACAQQ